MMKFRQNEFYSTHFVEGILKYEFYLVIAIKIGYTGIKDLFMEIIDDKECEKKYVRNKALETKAESNIKEAAEAMKVQEDILNGVIKDLKIIADEIGCDNMRDLKGACCSLKFHELNNFMFKYKDKLMLKKDGKITESNFTVKEFEGLRMRLGMAFSKTNDGSRFPEFFNAVSSDSKPDMSLVKIESTEPVIVSADSRGYDVELINEKGLMIKYNNGNNEEKSIIISKDKYSRMFILDDYNLRKSRYIKTSRYYKVSLDGMQILYESCLGYSAEQVMGFMNLDKEVLLGLLKDITFLNWNNFIIRHNTISRKPEFLQSVYVLGDSYVFEEPNIMLRFHICENCVNELDVVSDRVNKFLKNNEIELSKRYKF